MGLVGISSFRVLLIHFLHYVIVIRDHQLRQFRHLEDVVEGQKSLLEFGPIHVATSMKPANSNKINFINFKSFCFLTAKMQSTLLQEIQEWMEAYTTVLYRRTLRDMERLMVVFNLLDKKLDRKIRDLEDTRISMDCLRDIRIQEVEFEMAIELVEVKPLYASLRGEIIL